MLATFAVEAGLGLWGGCYPQGVGQGHTGIVGGAIITIVINSKWGREYLLPRGKGGGGLRLTVVEWYPGGNSVGL